VETPGLFHSEGFVRITLQFEKFNPGAYPQRCWVHRLERCVSDKSFGQQVRTQREIRGISLRHLSTMTGISASTISRIENGRFSPTYDNTLRITSALGMDAVEIPAVFRAGATASPLPATPVADEHSNLGSLHITKVNLTVTRFKKGQRKNLSKIAMRTAAKEMLLLQGTVQARSNSGIRETLRPGARITCAAILRHTLFGDAISDAELLWIGS
jgi:hypothetical protein